MKFSLKDVFLKISSYSSLLQPRVAQSSIASRKIHSSRQLYGLDEFFENGQSLPPFDPTSKKTYGRAWATNELRLKSFEDLHRLWFVLLKEMNLLATQKSEATRVGQRWFGMHRVHKVSLPKRSITIVSVA